MRGNRGVVEGKTGEELPQFAQHGGGSLVAWNFRRTHTTQGLTLFGVYCQMLGEVTLS